MNVNMYMLPAIAAIEVLFKEEMPALLSTANKLRLSGKVLKKTQEFQVFVGTIKPAQFNLYKYSLKGQHYL